jgi:hypothetical protein
MRRHRGRVAAAITGAALALAILAGCRSSGSTRPLTTAQSLARQLAARADRGSRSTWLVTYSFVRTTNAGTHLNDTVATAHVAATGRTAALDVDSGLGSLVVTSDQRTYSCTIVGAKPDCLQSAGVGTSTPGAVYGGAVVSGRYSISVGPDVTLAGVTGRCFFLRLKHGSPLSGLGFSSEQCYSAAGIPLRSRIQRSGALDARDANLVVRAVTRADLLPILTPYGLQRLAPAA